MDKHQDEWNDLIDDYIRVHNPIDVRQAEVETKVSWTGGPLYKT